MKMGMYWANGPEEEESPPEGTTIDQDGEPVAPGEVGDYD